MSYRATNESSTQTPQERSDEARRILFKMELRDQIDVMTDHEANFVGGLANDMEVVETVAISPKQLFWLRDLAEKYL